MRVCTGGRAAALFAGTATALLATSLWSIGGAHADSPARAPASTSATPNSSSRWPGSIAFSRCAADGSGCQIAVAGPGGSGVGTLTSTGFNADPAWSPDGATIAFASGGSASTTQIDMMNADGSAATQLTSLTGTQSSPAWSADGTKIAFTSTSAGNSDVWVMNGDGTGLTQLTHNSAADSSPSWSSDGKHIAFQSNRSGNNDVWTIGADGTGVRQLTHKSTFDGRPAWAPDGGAIAFSSTRSGNMDVWVINADGRAPRALTTAPGVDNDPAWSPNGAEVVFRSDRSGATALWTVGRTASFAPYQLTTPSGEDAAPDWQAITGTDWSRYQFDDASTGDNEFETTIGRDNVADLHQSWDTILPGTGIDLGSSPVAVNGVVFVAASGQPGGIFALDAATGAVLWNAPIADQGNSPSTPAVSNGVLYTGYDGKVYALDTLTGSTVWTTTVSDLFSGVPPTGVFGGFVFVGGSSGSSATLMALDADTGDVAWTAPVDRSIDGAAAVSAGVVFVQTRGSTLAFDATSGLPLWSKYETQGPSLSSSPAVSGGSVFVTFAIGRCHLSAVASTTGTPAWVDKLTFSGCDELSAAVRGQRVFFSAGGKLFSYDAVSGRAVWRATNGGWPAVPSVANGVVYSTCHAGDVCAYDSSTGDSLWTAGITTPVASAPAVANGVLFVGGNANLGGAHVYAFQP
jgi:Tol biopolymer transport system component